MSGESIYPETVEVAVRLLLDMVPSDEQARIAAMPRDAVVELHWGLGMWVRNNLGLWSSSGALFKATGQANADDASMVVVEAFWQRLRDTLPKLH